MEKTIGGKTNRTMQPRLKCFWKCSRPTAPTGVCSPSFIHHLHCQLSGSHGEPLTYFESKGNRTLRTFHFHTAEILPYSHVSMLIYGNRSFHDNSRVFNLFFKESLQSAAFHPKAFVLAVGTQSGNWMVLDSITGDQLGAFHDGPEQLDAIKYSPGK